MRKDIEQLANSSNLEDKIQAAKHSALFIVASDIAEKLVDDENISVRFAIATHPDLFAQAPHIVEKLANDKNSFVCMALEKNAHKQGIDLKEFLTQYFKTS